LHSRPCESEQETMSDFDFSDLTPIAIPVVGPDGENYILKEATGRAAKIYNNARIEGVMLEAGQPKTIKGIGGLEPLLVSLCLWADNDRPVTQQFIEGWPSKVVKKLYNKAKEISDLDEEEKESPTKTALKACLSHEDSPITFQQLRDHVLKIEQNGSALKPLFEEGDEELVKNSPSSTMAGSE
jgi:hypothetical protein